jgi:hypothetical protein
VVSEMGQAVRVGRQILLPFCSCDGRELPAFCQLLPDCQLANLSRWAGEIALPRKLGALDGAVLSDVSFERQL